MPESGLTCIISRQVIGRTEKNNILWLCILTPQYSVWRCDLALNDSVPSLSVLKFSIMPFLGEGAVHSPCLFGQEQTYYLTTGLSLYVNYL